ncbi:hypothetical protein QFZ37_002919 [Chryseobacterium ginsenosidimutans]|uniref:hypothetical protein n=1 Tax=Chryseobacterium ginsenosidimutans TaxID=687846 RepID=UPI002787094E|nr:hypothetical protein [Chryseobacterium ginsenosidimutans]MDQ0594550.1 hypothetical protein [Chryseobacterium ginsenosidimutans]
MNLKISLAKKTLIFYSIIGFVIGCASIYNLIWGVILHKTPTYRIGLFSLFGFIIFPVLIISTYLKNKCVIERDNIQIEKIKYSFSEYDFLITTHQLAFKDRSLFSIFRKDYFDFVIKETNTNNIVFETDLDVFQKDIEKMKRAFPAGKIKYQ